MRSIESISKVVRPKMGDTVSVAIFRVFRQYSAIYAEDILGGKGAIVIFQNAGRELGKEISKSLKKDSLEVYLKDTKKFIEDAKLGLLLIEHASSEKLVLQLDECITCAGMENIGQRICYFEAGIVGGVVEGFTGKRVMATETKCGANGEGICEVTVTL